MRRVWLFLLVAGVSLVFAQRALADGMCRRQAMTDYQTCKKDCKDDFAVDRFSCRNLDPNCGIPCLAGREACMDDVQDILTSGMLPDGTVICSTMDANNNVVTGTDGCESVFKAAKQNCGAPCPTPTPSASGGETSCESCVDTAQIANFECHDACRDAYRSNSTVSDMKAACKSGFQACIAKCGPAPTPTPGS